jgi:hypothetical protein
MHQTATTTVHGCSSMVFEVPLVSRYHNWPWRRVLWRKDGTDCGMFGKAAARPAGVRCNVQCGRAHTILPAVNLKVRAVSIRSKGLVQVRYWDSANEGHCEAGMKRRLQRRLISLVSAKSQYAERRMSASLRRPWSRSEQRSFVFCYPERYPEHFRCARAEAAKRAQAIDMICKYLVLPEGIELSTSPLPTAGRGTPGNAMG